MKFVGVLMLAAAAGWAADSQASLQQQAVDAVRAMRSVVSSGVAYRDYASRVLDARIQVDRYLQSKGAANTLVRTTVSRAMNYYEAAGLFWNVTLGWDTARAVSSFASGSGSGEETDKLLEAGLALKNNGRLRIACAALDATMKPISYPLDTPGKFRDFTLDIVVHKDQIIHALWSCGAQQVQVAADEIDK